MDWGGVRSQDLASVGQHDLRIKELNAYLINLVIRYLLLCGLTQICVKGWSFIPEERIYRKIK